jgi:chloramphenicol 3-O phosphotransferase
MCSSYGLHCPLPELERREVARGDRRMGEARADYRKVHSFGVYDLDLNSTESLDLNVSTLIFAWKACRRPHAFDRMAARDFCASI